MNDAPVKIPYDLLILMVHDDYDSWRNLLIEHEYVREFVRENRFHLECFFSANKLKEVRLGLEHKLTISQIEDYTQSRFSAEQMKCIREAYENGLSQEQVRLVLSEKFQIFQMNEIITGLLNGLSIEQVQTYAKPSLKWQIMHEERIELEQENKINELTRIMNNF